MKDDEGRLTWLTDIVSDVGVYKNLRRVVLIISQDV